MGLVFLGSFGTTGALRLLMLSGLVFAGVGARHYGLRSGFAVLGCVLGALVFLLPNQGLFWLGSRVGAYPPHLRHFPQGLSPHVVGVPNRSLILGSNEPIPIDLKAWLERLGSPPVTSYLGPEIVEEVRKRLIKFEPHVRAGRRPKLGCQSLA